MPAWASSRCSGVLPHTKAKKIRHTGYSELDTDVNVSLNGCSSLCKIICRLFKSNSVWNILGPRRQQSYSNPCTGILLGILLENFYLFPYVNVPFSLTIFLYGVSGFGPLGFQY